MGTTHPLGRRARVCRGQGGADVPRTSRRAAAARLRPTLRGVPWPARGSDVYRAHVISLCHQLPTVVGVPG
jgi:hypothetical protein